MGPHAASGPIVFLVSSVVVPSGLYTPSRPAGWTRRVRSMWCVRAWVQSEICDEYGRRTVSAGLGLSHSLWAVGWGGGH
jgi:hypothetical protein